MANYHWPPAKERKLIGKRVARVDGPVKSSGRAKYTYDIVRPGMLYASVVRSPYAHAKVVSIDTSAAEKIPGVKAIHRVKAVGDEIFWAGDDVVAVAAVDEPTADDAARAIKVEYRQLEHLVSSEKEPSRQEAESSEWYKVTQSETTGSPEKALAAAEVVSEGVYGLPVITHCCLEPHGSISEWPQADRLLLHISTQNVSGIGGEVAEAIGIRESDVRVQQQHVGGGFGSKLGNDPWGAITAKLSKEAGGAPVKLMLDRAAELEIAGCRPSAYARVKVGAKKDGSITAWDSYSWGSGGPGGGGSPPLPYIIEVPNIRKQHVAVVNNIGPARAWRAPNHPQACLITMAALEDAAAKLGMNPLDFFLHNISLFGPRSNVYAQELKIADGLMGWRARWHPRGDKSGGAVKRGLGLSLHTWGGRGHNSNCDLSIRSDGSVSIRMGTQDIGTGTRTAILMVAADTLGIPMNAINLEIGDSALPFDGASGGSTTIGGVSSSTRRAATDARDRLFATVASSLNARPEELEAADGKIRVAAAPSRSLSWKDACAKLGANGIAAHGTNPGEGDLINSGVGGVQMADVSVDTETGIVKINKMVAVQDCGLVINPKTAESQCLGALIMGISYALYEEKVMDDTTGRMLNANMDFYRLAGIGDVGELVVHMMTGEGYDERGVIGLGEPPVVSPGAAISNAVANAIGVRVPHLPLTPERVLAALESAGAKA